MLWSALLFVGLTCTTDWWSRASPTLFDKSFVENSAHAPRPMINVHNLSGLIYLIGGIYSVVEGETDFAIILFGAWFSSTLYHLSREGRYFNLDFLFAASLGFAFLWAMFLAAPSDLVDSVIPIHLSSLRESSNCVANDTTFFVGIAGMPLAIFLFWLCGTPSEIVSVEGLIRTAKSEKNVGCIWCRRDSTIYNQIHPLWHLVSGIGPIWCCRFFASCSPSESMTMGAEDFILAGVRFPTVLAVSLLISLTMNLMLNFVGFFPLL